jgi:hypothetical protein
MEYEMNRYLDWMDDIHETEEMENQYMEEMYWTEKLGYNPFN